jgi:hypothetical protein
MHAPAGFFVSALLAPRSVQSGSRVSVCMEQPTSKETLLRQVDDLRGQARRARRLAQTLIEDRDRTTLLGVAKDLDEQADRIEKQAADANSMVQKR